MPPPKIKQNFRETLFLVPINSVILFQIRKLQEVAKELEDRMKNIADEMRQREAETEKLRQALRNTPPNDPAYVCSCIAVIALFWFYTGFQLSIVKPKQKQSLWPITVGEDKPSHQSELETNTCSRRQARQNDSKLVFVSLLIGWENWRQMF